MTPEETMRAVHDALVAEGINVSPLHPGPNERTYFTLSDIGKPRSWKVGAHHFKDDSLTVDLGISPTGMKDANRDVSLSAAVAFVSHFVKRPPSPRVPSLRPWIHSIDGTQRDRYVLDVTTDAVEEIVSMLRELNRLTWPSE
jgi:hypothetical protein